ncbi:TPA: hypothetical protein ACH3X2_010214 [Trebouxia sp. C0005]
MEVPNEPGLSPNNGLENALLSDQSMASNPRKGQAKRSGAKTTSHDGKAGHVMTHLTERHGARCWLQQQSFPVVTSATVFGSTGVLLLPLQPRHGDSQLSN